MNQEGRKIIPPEHSIQAAGFTRTKDKITRTEEEIGKINPEAIYKVMRFIRRKVYTTGLVDPSQIKDEAHLEACREQSRENLLDPINQENAERFHQRERFWINTLIIRALTLTPTEIQRDILGETRARFRKTAEPERVKTLILTHNSETNSAEINQNNIDILCLPLDIALDIIAFTENPELMEKLPEQEKMTMLAMAEEAHSQLIKRLLTNNPEVIDIGQKYFKYNDYIRILNCSPGDLGEGEIGNKAVGVETARIILETPLPGFDKKFINTYITANCKSKEDNEIMAKRWKGFSEKSLEHNQSYHIGASVLQELITHNPGLSRLHILKRIYLQDPKEYDDKNVSNRIYEAEFPPYIEQHLKELYARLVSEFEGSPIIVRSSSDLEDRGGTKQKGASFAGQYESIVCSGKEDAFKEFLHAIKTVYASVYSSSVFEYRKDHGLINEFEKMGVLIQRLNGEIHGKYFFPEYSGVILSHALNSMGADPKKGQVKICTGLANTVVDNRGGRDICFDTPAHNPYPDYKQNKIFVVNMESGELEELRIEEVLPFIQNPDIISKERTFSYSTKQAQGNADLKGILTRNQFSLIRLLHYYMEKLKYALGYNVDIEFTAKKIQENEQIKYKVKIVQCRPQAFNDKIKPTILHNGVKAENILMDSQNKLNCGSAENIRFIMYVDPDCYSPNIKDEHNPDNENTGLDFHTFKGLNRWINQVNGKLTKRNWGLIVPGRLGDNPTSELGISARFGDYKNANFIMELTGANWEGVPPSSGSHDAQLIAEKGMLVLGYELPKKTDQRAKLFELLENETNILKELCPEIPTELLTWIRVVDMEQTGKKHGFKKCRLHASAFNGEGGRATLYIAEKNQHLPQPIML